METIIQHLNEPQRKAVMHVDGPLLLIAGAGSGKTRVITHRIAFMLKSGIQPWNILAVTFTNKAAEEMKNRVERLMPGKARDVVLSTFHSFCAKLLRMEAANIGLNPHFIIYDDTDQKNIIKECLTALELDEKKYRPGMILELISRAKDELIDAASYEIHSQASGEDFRLIVAGIYKLYEEKLKKAGALDFGDLIMKTVEALRDNIPLREKYQDRFKYVMVDEYQDTNHAQYLLTKYIAAKHKNICVVGDEDQSIYMWRGADIRNILEFERDYKDVAVIKLEQNYRSTKNILAGAANVIRNNASRKVKELWTQKNSGEEITSCELSSDIDEARFVAREIRRLIENGDCMLKDIAIFYRTNAQSRVIEDALRHSELPYKVFGSVRFYDRSEVKDILCYLRVCVNPNDSLSLKRVINVPARGIGKSTIELLEKYANTRHISLYETFEQLNNIEGLQPRAQRSLLDFKNLLNEIIAEKDKCNVQDFIKFIIERTAYIKMLEEENSLESEMRIGNVKELVNAANDFIQFSGEEDTASFLEQIALVAGIDDYDQDKNYVSMMTIHLAKGLEFPVVFMVGLEEGLFPIGESFFDREELEEERRLCYVGMTRAKDKLYMLSASSRRLYGQQKWSQPSRFINEAILVKPEPIREYVEECVVADDGIKYKIGLRVNHSEFGSGKIIEKNGEGEDLRVLVFFDNGQKKKLVVKYAKLDICV